MSRRHGGVMAVGAGLAVAVAVATVVLLTRASSGARASNAAATTVAISDVRRTTLVDAQLFPGTLARQSLPPVVNEASGTYTWLPRVGATIGFGHPLYRVDDVPVTLMRGNVPAWRAFQPGMTPGPDVAELNRDLVRMGYESPSAAGTLDIYGYATEFAVARWQAATGRPQTGVVAFGDIVFRTTTLRVSSVQALPGSPAGPGLEPLQVTARRFVVTMSVDAGNASLVHLGGPVSIDLPQGGTVAGRIVTAAPTGRGSSAGIQATIQPALPTPLGSADQEAVQVGLRTNVARDVLAAPITALVALAGGGYGVEVVPHAGREHLVRVRTGLFATGLVELHGRGIRAGTRVVVAQ